MKEITETKTTENLEEENELDSTCGVSDDEFLYRFREAVRIQKEISRIKGCPIAKYDADKRIAYLEYPDGRIEYVKKA